jgi:hypothetical protein
MGKLPLIAAVASIIWTLPASAAYPSNINLSTPTPAVLSTPTPAATLAQLDVCAGPDCRRERERRYFGRYDDDRRYRHGERCREVTVRERRGHDIVVRHERRCD